MRRYGAPHRVIVSSLNCQSGLKHALDMVQNSFTVWRERSAAFQAVRITTAGGKPALRTVKLKPGT